jgi:urease accessory protein UreF
VVSAAVRLGVVGPIAGQRMMRGMGPTMERVIEECGALEEGEIAQTAPMVEVMGMMQDRLYSRLFQS